MTTDNGMSLVNATDGTLTARCEYGPFGEPLRSTGAMGPKNPFRFSTKFTDPHSAFLYYGYRFYNPTTGRWLNRDPIGELGFVAAHSPPNDSELAVDAPYVLLSNQPLTETDILGLRPSRCPRNSCDHWQFTATSIGSASTVAGPAMLLVSGILTASQSCCMEVYGCGYRFIGGGLGVGVKVSFTVGTDAHNFFTPCLELQGHEGMGRVTAAGFGLWWSYGTAWLHTPHSTIVITGPGKGFDWSATTTIGRWSLDRSIVEPFGFAD